MSTRDATAKGPGNRRLLPHQRRMLASILAGKPGWSCRLVALEFEARAGRPIAYQSVAKLRRAGGYAERPGNGHLTPAEREALDLLIFEGSRRDGNYATCREVVDQLEALTGRRVREKAVHSRRLALGFPRVGRGFGTPPGRRARPVPPPRKGVAP